MKGGEKRMGLFGDPDYWLNKKKPDRKKYPKCYEKYEPIMHVRHANNEGKRKRLNGEFKEPY